jgi:hypothetical protein
MGTSVSAAGLKYKVKAKAATKAAKKAPAANKVNIPLLIPEGARRIKSVVLQPSSKLVQIDRVQYQRDPIRSEVRDLTYVLNHGGIFPHPLIVAKRTYGPQDGLIWIIDGQQRWLAAVDANKAVNAELWEVDSLEAEKILFIICDTMKILNANLTVNSWPGPVSALIRGASENPEHPLFGRVALRKGGGDSMIGAAILARGLCALLSLDPGTGETQGVLRKVDKKLQEGPQNRIRADALLNLIGRVFPSGHAPVLAAIAIGQRAKEKWAEDLQMPSKHTIQRLSKVDWRCGPGRLVPSWAIRFLSVIYDVVKGIWR